MLEQTRSPLQIRGFAAPLLRPLPTILTYVNLSANAGHSGNSVGRRQFTVHVRAFKVMLVALTRSARIPSDATGPLLRRCQDLERAGFWDLRDLLTGFLEELQALHKGFGPLLKDAAREQAAHLGRLFRSETGPSRLIAVYNDQTKFLEKKLLAKLVDDCWYEGDSQHENDGLSWLTSCDLVLLVSSDTPIRKDIEQAVQKAQVPTLVLFDHGKAKETQSMAALRTEHLYRQNGHRVLRGPFASVRLYQAIDSCLVRHLLGQEALLPSMEAVTS